MSEWANGRLVMRYLNLNVDRPQGWWETVNIRDAIIW